LSKDLSNDAKPPFAYGAEGAQVPPPAPAPPPPPPPAPRPPSPPSPPPAVLPQALPLEVEAPLDFGDDAYVPAPLLPPLSSFIDELPDAMLTEAGRRMKAEARERKAEGELLAVPSGELPVPDDTLTGVKRYNAFAKAYLDGERAKGRELSYMEALGEIKKFNLYTKESAPPQPDWLLEKKAYHSDTLNRLDALGLPREVRRYVFSKIPSPQTIQAGKWPNELLGELAAEVMPYSVKDFSASKKRRWSWAFDYWFDNWYQNEKYDDPARDYVGRHSLKVADALKEVKAKGLFGAKQVGELDRIMPAGL